jgi:hypothetical protein
MKRWIATAVSVLGPLQTSHGESAMTAKSRFAGAAVLMLFCLLSCDQSPSYLTNELHTPTIAPGMPTIL